MAPRAQPAGPAEGCEALSPVFALLGKRWSGLIVAPLLEGPMRFNELIRGVGAISERMLSLRLGELAGAGLIERALSAGPPVVVSYRLTERGPALRPALDRLG